MPRPPHPAATVALVRELLGRNLSTRDVVKAARQQGIPVSLGTVSQIKSGRYRQPKPPTARLAPGETRLKEPQRCRAGHLCRVLPCRTCAALEVLHAIQAHRRAADMARLEPATRRPRGGSAAA